MLRCCLGFRIAYRAHRAYRAYRAYRVYRANRVYRVYRAYRPSGFYSRIACLGSNFHNISMESLPNLVLVRANNFVFSFHIYLLLWKDIKLP